MALISCYSVKQLEVIQQNNPRSLAEDQYSQNPGAEIPDAFRRLQQSVGKNGSGEKSNTNHKPDEMSMMVTTRPNPFFTTVTLDVTCDQNKHIIVRMFDEAGKIIKMLSWYVMKGSNVTSINDLNILNSGKYFLDVIDTDGTVLFNTILSKK
jgi:hypothetical protein